MSTFIFDLDHTLYSDHDFNDKASDIYPTFKEKPLMRKLLHQLPYNKFIITNGNKAHADVVVRKLGIDDVFPIQRGNENECMITVDDVSNPKPHVEPYFLAMKKFNLSHDNEVLFFEDNVDNLATAKNLGWGTVLINPNPIGKYQFPEYVDYVFPSIEDSLLFFQIRDNLKKNKKKKS
jgi:FMN phosphatase YigB (HAD superfamily)